MPARPRKRKARAKKRIYEQLRRSVGGAPSISHCTEDDFRRLANFEHYDLLGEMYDPKGNFIQGSLTKMSKKRRDELADLGRENSHFLATGILDFTRLTTPDGVHGRMCKIVDDQMTEPVHRLQLWPRGLFKTTIFNYTANIQRVIRDPYSSHIIVTADAEFQGMMSAQIAALVTEPVFQFFYPEIRPQKDRWSTGIRTIERPGRARIQEATWEFRTVKRALAARHVDSITIDDAVNDVNIRTLIMHQHVLDFIDALAPALDTKDLMVIGTRYADWDMYGHILDNPEKARRYESVAECLYVEEKGERIFLFPGEWDDEVVADKMADMGLSRFSAQYMNNPLPEALQRFHKKMFKYFATPPDCGIYHFVDPASGKGTSEPAIVVLGITAEGDIYVLDYETGFGSVLECVNAVFRMYAEHGGLQVCVEVMGAGGKIMFENIQHEAVKRKIALPIVELPITQENKEKRIIQSLEPVYTAGIMYHAQWMNESPFEEQLLRFPKGKHDDIIDALAYGVQRVRRYGYSGAPTEPEEDDELTLLRQATTRHMLTPRQLGLMSRHGIPPKKAGGTRMGRRKMGAM